MNKHTAHLIVTLLCASIFLCPAAPVRAQDNATGNDTESDILILYYSLTGNTEACCRVLQDHLSADLIEVKDLKNRESTLGIIGGMFRTILGMHTPIEPEQVNMAPYKTVILAAPIWASKFAPAMRTFIDKNRFSGKSVVLFSTSDTLLAEKYKKKKIDKVREQGGTVVGYFEVRAADEKDGDKVPRSKDAIRKDAAEAAVQIEQAIASHNKK